MGVQFQIPTIGIAKNYFWVNGLVKDEVIECINEKLNCPKDSLCMIDPDGKAWGAALRTTKDATAPIYVSNGHKCSLQTAIDIVRLTIDENRIPEPLRQADLRSKAKVRELYDRELFDNLQPYDYSIKEYA